MKTKTKEEVSIVANKTYSVEFFHIYTDEEINKSHIASIDYLRTIQKAWDIDHKLIVMVDNYNPNEHITSADQVLKYLKNEGVEPEFWAYEADLVDNAKQLIESINKSKLKKSYLKYVENKGKYPCSLLTAAWYLTRLGKLDSKGVIQTLDSDYEPVERLINILPQYYKPVEERAAEIIAATEYSSSLSQIQDLFYEDGPNRHLDLF